MEDKLKLDDKRIALLKKVLAYRQIMAIIQQQEVEYKEEVIFMIQIEAEAMENHANAIRDEFFK